MPNLTLFPPKEREFQACMLLEKQLEESTESIDLEDALYQTVLSMEEQLEEMPANTY